MIQRLWKTSSLVVDSGTFSVLRDDWKCWFSQLAMSPEGVAWWFLWQVLNILLTSPDWLGHLQQDDVTWTRIAGRYQEWFIWGIILLTCWTFMYGKSIKKQQLPFGDCNPSHLWQHWGRHGGYHINYCSVWEVLYCSPVTPVYKPPQNLGFVLDLFILVPKWDNYSWIIRMADEVGDGCRLVVSAHMGFPENAGTPELSCWKPMGFDDPPLFQKRPYVPRLKMDNAIYIYITGWWFGTIFPYIGNNNPNWLIFFRGLKPPTSYTYIPILGDVVNPWPRHRWRIWWLAPEKIAQNCPKRSIFISLSLEVTAFARTYEITWYVFTTIYYNISIIC